MLSETTALRSMHEIGLPSGSQKLESCDQFSAMLMELIQRQQGGAVETAPGEVDGASAAESNLDPPFDHNSPLSSPVSGLPSMAPRVPETPSGDLSMACLPVAIPPAPSIIKTSDAPATGTAGRSNDADVLHEVPRSAATRIEDESAAASYIVQGVPPAGIVVAQPSPRAEGASTDIIGSGVVSPLPVSRISRFHPDDTVPGEVASHGGVSVEELEDNASCGQEDGRESSVALARTSAGLSATMPNGVDAARQKAALPPVMQLAHVAGDGAVLASATPVEIEGYSISSKDASVGPRSLTAGTTPPQLGPAPKAIASIPQTAEMMPMRRPPRPPQREEAGIDVALGPVVVASTVNGLVPVAVSAPSAAPMRQAPAIQIAPAAVALSLGTETRGAIIVTLDPVELGRVDVRVERQGDLAQVVIIAERPETLQLLLRDQATLDRALSQAGIGTEGRSLSFSLGGEGRGGQGRERRPQTVPQTRPITSTEASLGARSVTLLDIAV